MNRPLNKLGELYKMMEVLLVGGYKPGVPMSVQSYYIQTEVIMKYVEDMIAEAEYTAWGEGYEEGHHEGSHGME